MKRRTLLAPLFSLICFLQTALAADLQFEGTPTYSIARSKVTLNIPKIVNHSTTRSGPIYVQVWAMATNYTGGNSFPAAFMMAQKALLPLNGNAAYSNIVASVPFKIPTDGDFYTIIAIHETKPLSIPADFVNVPGQFHFMNGPQINMEGPATWTLASNGAVVKMNVGKISNDALYGRTGTLRLELWATPAPYEGGAPQNGYMLGNALLTPLSAGFSITNISKASGLKSPPGGFYYTTLIVSEFSGRTFAPLEYINIPGNFYFGGPSANAPKIDLQGYAAWINLGKTVKIGFNKLVNPRNGSASGALIAKLYSTPSPLNGGPLPPEAQLLATANFGTIKGSVTLSNLARTVAFTQPTFSTNYMTLVLFETISPNNLIEQDTYSFSSSAIITNGQQIGITESSFIPNILIGRLHFGGQASYSVTKDNLNLNVDFISNHNVFDTNEVSGPVMCRVWGVPSATNQVTVPLADRYLGRLKKGSSFTNIRGPIPFMKPAAGKYRVKVIIYEWVDWRDQSGQGEYGWLPHEQLFFNNFLTVR